MSKQGKYAHDGFGVESMTSTVFLCCCQRLFLIASSCYSSFIPPQRTSPVAWRGFPAHQHLEGCGRRRRTARESVSPKG